MADPQIPEPAPEPAAPQRLVFRQLSPPTYTHTPFRLRRQSVFRRWTDER